MPVAAGDRVRRTGTGQVVQGDEEVDHGRGTERGLRVAGGQDGVGVAINDQVARRERGRRATHRAARVGQQHHRDESYPRDEGPGTAPGRGRTRRDNRAATRVEVIETGAK